jgi:hypothetical protein
VYCVHRIDVRFCSTALVVRTMRGCSCCSCCYCCCCCCCRRVLMMLRGPEQQTASRSQRAAQCQGMPTLPVLKHPVGVPIGCNSFMHSFMLHLWHSLNACARVCHNKRGIAHRGEHMCLHTSKLRHPLVEQWAPCRTDLWPSRALSPLPRPPALPDRLAL